jgi:hypothetical protein
MGNPGFNFSLLQNLEIGAGAHPSSYSKGTSVVFTGVNRPELETDQ